MERFSIFIRDNIRLLLGAFVVILIAALLLAFALNRKSDQVTINGQSFKVSVADDEKERQIGLSDTEKINDDEGMLFLFDSPEFYSFWMRDMDFPLDIIFINGDKVTTVIENAKPAQNDSDLEIYEPTEASDKVLEVNSGVAKKHNIKPGDRVEISN